MNNSTERALAQLLDELTYAVNRARGKTTITENDLSTLRAALVIVQQSKR